MKNQVGPPVTGNDFFGRKKELLQAWDLLDNGNHLLLPAPRRVGKTSFVLQLRKDAQKHDWKAIYFNVEDGSDETGFMRMFVDALKKEENWFKKNAKNTFDSIGKIMSSLEAEVEVQEVKTTLKWSNAAKSDLKRELEKLLEDTGKCLIIIDELPVLLSRLANIPEGKGRVGDFLHWLRSFRQNPDSEIRWIFCGSISMDTFAERLGITKTINDLYSFSLGAFGEEEARQFLQQLATDQKVAMSAEVQEALIKAVGWPLPYYLQLLFAQLRFIHNQPNGLVLTPEHVTTAFERASDSSNLNTWIERLEEQLAPTDAKWAKNLLDTLCVKEKGFRRDQLEQVLVRNNVTPEEAKDKTAFLLKTLTHDGYLIEHTGEYGFRSPLLRNYWYKQRLQ